MISNFEAQIDAIGARPLGGETPVAAKAPASNLRPLALAASVSMPPGVDAVLVQLRSGLDGVVQEQRALIDGIRVAKDQGTADFKQRLQAARQRAIDETTRVINEAYAQLKDIGQQNPSAQAALLAACEQVHQLADSAVGEISTALNSVADVGKIVLGGAQDAAQQVADACTQAANALKDTAQKIGDALGSVFSGW